MEKLFIYVIHFAMNVEKIKLNIYYAEYLRQLLIINVEHFSMLIFLLKRKFLCFLGITWELAGKTSRAVEPSPAKVLSTYLCNLS